MLQGIPPYSARSQPGEYASDDGHNDGRCNRKDGLEFNQIVQDDLHSDTVSTGFVAGDGVGESRKVVSFMICRDALRSSSQTKLVVKNRRLNVIPDQHSLFR